MGASGSVLSDSVQRHCSSEFQRLCPKTRNFLVLSELRQLQSIEDMPIDFGHMGTLWVLDSDRNGRVTLEELLAFASLYAQQRSVFKDYDFPFQIQAYFSLRMFDEVTVEGVDAWVMWFTLLFSESHLVKTFPEYPGVAFLARDCAHIVHEVLQVDEHYGYDVQRFFDLVQRTGEEMGIMSIEDERLDELVPRVALEKFAEAYIEGFLKLMKDQLYFQPQTPLPKGEVKTKTFVEASTPARRKSSPALANKPEG